MAEQVFLAIEQAIALRVAGVAFERQQGGMGLARNGETQGE
jgi:hypothetical protein